MSVVFNIFHTESNQVAFSRLNQQLSIKYENLNISNFFNHYTTLLSIWRKSFIHDKHGGLVFNINTHRDILKSELPCAEPAGTPFWATKLFCAMRVGNTDRKRDCREGRREGWMWPIPSVQIRKRYTWARFRRLQESPACLCNSIMHDKYGLYGTVRAHSKCAIKSRI